MRLSKKNGYVPTEYEVMVCFSSNYAIYRKVWEKDGKFYVSYEGEICDVTYRKEHFIHWN